MCFVKIYVVINGFYFLILNFKWKEMLLLYLIKLNSSQYWIIKENLIESSSNIIADTDYYSIFSIYVWLFQIC